MKPGRTPISVVLNEASKRKTSAQVAFVDKERLLGDEAAALSSRYPDRVYARCVGSFATSKALVLEAQDHGLPRPFDRASITYCCRCLKALLGS